jgi:signal peptidase I
VIPILAQAESGPSKYQQLFDQLARTPLSHVLLFVAICTVVRFAIYPYLTKTAPHLRPLGMYGQAKFLNEILDAIIYAGVVVFMLIRPFAVQTFLIPSESMVKTLLVNDFIIANKAVYRYTTPQRGDILVFRPPVEALDSTQTDVDFIKRLIGKPGDVVEVKDGTMYRNGKPCAEPYINEPPMKLNWKLVHYEGPYPEWKDRYIPVYMDPMTPEYANWHSPTAHQYAIGWDPTFPGATTHSLIPEDYMTGKSAWKDPSAFTAEEQARMHYLVAAPPAKVPDGYYLMMGDNRNSSYDGRGWGLVPGENIVGRSEVIWWPPSRWSKTRRVPVGEDATGNG